jgi:hypothetical protein
MLDTAPLERTRVQLAIPLQTLWRHCLGIGGSLTLPELTAYLGGADVGASRMNHDVIVHVLNETLIERDLSPTLAYAAP